MRWKIERAVLVCALAGSLGGQETGFEVPARFGESRQIDRVLEKTSAGADVWVGEQDFEQLDATLKAVAKKLVAGEGGFEPLAAAVAKLRSVALAELKILEISRRAGDGGVVEATVRAELGGESREGGLLSSIGELETAWRRGDGAWTLIESRTGRSREATASRRAFKEITGEVFSAIPAFQSQLSRSVDEWRAELDVAVGIGVYGHHGISAGDANGDGVEDLYVAQPAGLPNRLLLGDGRDGFRDGTREAGLDVLDDVSMSLFVDVEGDGDQDLILIGAEPMLFRNGGQGRFRFDAASGLQPPAGRGGLYTGAALADFDLDGDLDLYVCSYDFWQSGSAYDAPTPYYDARNGPPNLLYRNRGDGTFEDVTGPAGLMVNNDRFSFSAAWGDYDGDGDPDLYVANDFGRNNLYRNRGDGTFEDVAAEAGVEDLGAGMSASWGDYDGDGRLDLYVSNMWSSAGQRLTSSEQFAEVAPDAGVRDQYRRQARGNSLFRNRGDGTFEDVSDAAGVTMGRWAWGSELVDLDNDGRLDIFVQNGYVTGERLDDL